jgi:hypothetical protein
MKTKLKNGIIFTRQRLAILLGGLWLLDGLLQLQPGMFSTAFAKTVIGPAAAGQLAIVADPMNLVMNMAERSPVAFTLVLAIVQIGLGAAILVPRSRRVGLWVSVPWGLGVWAIGEGYSGLLSGHAFMLSGSPGAALIYVVLALSILLGEVREVRPQYLLVWAWAIIWVLGAMYQLLPGQDSVADISGMIQASAQGAPGWLAGLDTQAIHIVSAFGSGATQAGPMIGMPGMMGATTGVGGAVASPSGLAWLLAGTELVVGLVVFLGRLGRRISVIAGCALALVFWVVGQGLGMWYSGFMTDPNSGPLLIIMGLAIWGCSQMDGVIRARVRAEMIALNQA